MSRKKNRSNIIDLSGINNLYYKLYNKYSKYNKKQLDDLQDKNSNLPADPNYDTYKTIISFCINNSKKNFNNQIKTAFKNIVEYIPSNSSSKDVCFKQYKDAKEIGRGFFGNVYLASKGKHKYAVKVQDIKVDFKGEIKDFKNEIEVSKKMGEIGVGPKIYDAYYCKYKGNYKFFIVQEYMNGGDLKSWLLENKLTLKLKNQLKMKLKKMHKHNYYHGDLHTGNIFVKVGCRGCPELFLGDFGLSKKQSDLSEKEIEYDNSGLSTIISGSWKESNDEVRELVIDEIINKKLVVFKI